MAKSESISIFDPDIVWPAIGSAFGKLHPRVQIRNPERKRLAAGFIFLALTEAAGVSRLGGAHDARKSTVFDPGYGLSERKYRLPLHGFVGHDGQLPS